MIDLSSINSNLLKSFIDNDFSGHDPFDSLNSKIFNLTPLKYSKIAKLIFTQLGKRSPINLRNLLLVPKSRNAKGVALIILGLIENFKISNDDYYLDQAKTLVDWLILNKCEKKIWSHNCWGYNFEWQARAFNVPKGSPNIVTTYFVSLAILKFSEITNNTELQNQALDSSFFMTKYLLNHNENEMTFNYVPNSKTFVHNANLFGAHWCLVAGKIMKNRGNSDSDTKTTCDDCEAGKYMDETGKTLCKECPIGYSQSKTGIPFCVSCLPGRYQNVAGKNKCEDCVAGKKF